MSNLVNKLYFKALDMKSRVLNVLKNESGEANLISIILILAIVIALAITFKGAIGSLFSKIWSSLFTNVDNVLN